LVATVLMIVVIIGCKKDDKEIVVAFIHDILILAVEDTERISVLYRDADEVEEENLWYFYYEAVTWSSDNPSVATVDEEGNVIAVSLGTANITATTKKGAKTTTCKIIVTNFRMTMNTAGITGGIYSVWIAGTGTVSIDWMDGTNSRMKTYTLSEYDENDWNVTTNFINDKYRITHDYPPKEYHTERYWVGIKITGENITHIYCDYIRNLDVGKNTTLEWLSCHDKITYVDVRKCTALKYLNIGSTREFTSLDVRNNTALEYLFCGVNGLISLDLSQNTALKQLGCSCNCIPLMPNN